MTSQVKNDFGFPVVPFVHDLDLMIGDGFDLTQDVMNLRVERDGVD
jgi:hypothetical protein